MLKNEVVMRILIYLLLLFCVQSLCGQVDIAKLDKNFAVVKVGNLEVAYHDALSVPFKLEGFPFWKKGEPLRRIPSDIGANDINTGVYELANYTSGGVICFRTNSPYITLRTTLRNRYQMMGKMAMTGSSGFDFFADKDTYITTVNPLANGRDIPEPLEVLLAKDCPSKMRDYTLYLPLYNGVKSIEIGIAPTARVETPTPHKIKNPIVFYGSSITNGGCATRTSLVYPALLSRAVDAPMVNLGFPGCAKGESKMAEVISRLEMSLFVYDYDFNAPNVTHLAKTHEPFFKIIRKTHPNLPIIMLSRIAEATDERASIIRRTYENAKKSGDKNVWFIDGRNLVKDVPFALITIDGIHPNDLGFYLMYKNLLPTLKEALRKNNKY